MFVHTTTEHRTVSSHIFDVSQTLVATHFWDLVDFIIPSELLESRGFHVWEDSKQVSVTVLHAYAIHGTCVLACMV
jgi:hypothetical protein